MIPALRRPHLAVSRVLFPGHAAFSSAALQSKINKFKADVDTHLPADGKHVAFATAWLATDNVFLSLLKEHRPKVLDGMSLVAIDTLHLFPSTLRCAELVQTKYNKQALVKLPSGVSNCDEFEAQYGDCEDMDVADFDFVSKVEPFQRALQECKKEVLITGRRMDQASQRIELAVWEDGKQTFNPMASWSWQDITDYVDEYDVPVNEGHNYVYRSDVAIEATERHLPELPWEKHELGKPFWRCSEAELAGSSQVHYVYKSFGDTHTTVPVKPSESERAGRFVRQAKTECGIHTRTTSAGAPHGGTLRNLMVDQSEATGLVAACTSAIELNMRQACDVWSLLHGAFSPLTGFMTEPEYNSVVQGMRLPEKQVFGLPVTFDVSSAGSVKEGDKILLKWQGENVAVLEAESIFTPDKVVEAKE